MRKFFVFASVAILALASCAKEQEVVPVTNNDETVVLTFTSNRPQIDGETKTAWNTDKIVWSEGDKIRVGYQKDGNWMGQSGPGTAKFYASGAVTIDGSNSSVGTFQVPISGSAFTDPASSGSYQFFAIYPSGALTGTEVADPTSKNITVPASQTPGSGTFDPTADILVGKTEVMSISGLPTDPIALEWTRLVAHADLTFSNLAFVGAETVSKITLTFNTDAKVAGSVAVNIPAGTAGEGNTNEIVLSGSNITSGADFAKAWACVLPVTFTSLNVEVKTDKAIYTREITGISKTFKQNARNTLTINMSTADRAASGQYDWVKTDLAAITASDVFVIVGDNGDTYAMSNGNGTTSAPAAVAVTVANNKLTAVPADNLQWNLSVDEGNYTFYPNGTTETWLYCTNANNGVRVGDSANKVFTLDNSGYLKNTGTSRYVGIYNSQDWRCYTSSTQANITGQTFSFYVKTAAGPAVTWNLESIAITTEPTKTVYTEGQSFDPAGMVVTGHFVDADDNTNTKDEAVTGYTISPDGALSESDDHVTITYQGKSVDQAITVNPAPAGNDGSLEHPYTASEARTLALNGDTGSYYISGIVTKIQNQYSASYGTANFWIDENGTDQNVFEGYKIKYFGNVNWVEGNAEIALNDEVIIYGTLTVYNTTTPETSSGYLVSLNGITKALTLAAPTVTTNDSAKQITVAWTAATGTESAISYVVNCGTQSYNANAAGSHTFTMADYGTYAVSVIASASDAVSVTANGGNITLTDPQSSTKDYYKMVTDVSDISAGTYVIGALRSTSTTNNFYFGKASVSSGDWVVSDSYVTVAADGNGVRKFEVADLPAGAVEFTLTGDNTNGFTIKNGSNYLYFTTNSNRKLAFAAAGSSQKWVFAAKTDPLIEGGVYISAKGSDSYTISENSTGTGAIRGYANTTVYRAIYIFKKVNE